MIIVAAIPVYNEEAHIKEIICKTLLYVDDVILVDDGSTDATVSIARSLGVHVVSHEHNMGKEEALKRAFKEAMRFNPSILVTIYGNGVYNPDDIPYLLSPILTMEADIVNGACYSSSHTLSQELEELKTVGEPVKLSGFCAYSSRVFEILSSVKAGSCIERDIIAVARKRGYEITQVPVKLLDPDRFNTLCRYRIGVVVPAYNEEQLIEKTLEGIPGYVERIYVVNDCSSDNTASILENVRDPRVEVITHQVNRGVGAALISGYKQALREKMDITVIMAGDNQMNPDQLPRLLIPIIEGQADYTKANRLFSTDYRIGMSHLRVIGNALLTILTKIASGYWNIMDPQNGYTAISREALMNIGVDEIYTYYGYCNHMLIRLNAFGFRVTDVIMPARYGNERSTIKYGPYMFRVSFMLFRGFLWRLKMKYIILSFHPLVLFYVFSMFLLPPGILFGLGIFIWKAMGWHVSANYPLLDALMLLSGFQFLLFAMFFDMQESNRDMRRYY